MRPAETSCTRPSIQVVAPMLRHQGRVPTVLGHVVPSVLGCAEEACSLPSNRYLLALHHGSGVAVPMVTHMVSEIPPGDFASFCSYWKAGM